MNPFGVREVYRMMGFWLSVEDDIALVTIDESVKEGNRTQRAAAAIYRPL